METDKDIWVVWFWRDEESKLWDVINVDPDAHIGVQEVGFAHKNQAKVWISVEDVM